MLQHLVKHVHYACPLGFIERGVVMPLGFIEGGCCPSKPSLHNSSLIREGLMHDFILFFLEGGYWVFSSLATPPNETDVAKFGLC